MNFVVLDTETTGLKAYHHEMVSFAGIKLDNDLKEIDRTCKEAKRNTGI